MSSPADLANRRLSAPAWASGVVTGFESAVLSAAIVVAFAFVAVASAPSADGSIAADWAGGWDVAIGVWLLAHGAPATVDGVVVSLLPLGLTLATAVIAASVARRLAVASASAVICAGLAYGVLVAVVAGAEGIGSGGAFRAGAVGAVVCSAGAAAGLAHRGFRFSMGGRVPGIVARGVRLGLGTSFLVAATGAALVVAWTVASWGDVNASVRELDPDPGGGLALAVGETAYVPTLAVWGVSWLAGTGFSLGAGSHYGPGAATPGPAPDLPLLQVLPSSGGGMVALAPLILVALGAVARIAARRRLPAGAGGYACQGVAVAVVAGVWWALASVGTGSIGGGPLVAVGPRPVATGLAVGALTGAGMLAVSLIASGLRATASRPRTFAPTSPAPRPRVAAPPPQIPESNDPARLW